MLPSKPTQTLADYLVIAVSPALIMLLVGSLSFFLIECFFRGETVGSVRWVVFWYVLAVVLIARIGIEDGSGKAAVFGLALAGATWLYLLQVHPAYLMGMILLAVVWWCSNKLTRDCTLIDDDEDASGSGLLQEALPRMKQFAAKATSAASAAKPTKPAGRAEVLTQHPRVLHRPGLWLIYFSLAALPLFGIGQMLLPAGDAQARRKGLVLLFVYMAAALGLLLTTSFLGLRRYMRQRLLQMPLAIALGWVRFGGGVAVAVLMVALLLPRPGAMDAWTTLRVQVDHYLRQASDYAAGHNPPGEGRGRSKQEPGESAREGKGRAQPDPDHEQGETQASALPRSLEQPGQSPADSGAREIRPSRTSRVSAERVHGLLKAALVVIGAVFLSVWLIRHRQLVAAMARSFIAAAIRFFRDLLDLKFALRRQPPPTVATRPAHRFFRQYENPFVTGAAQVWPPEQVILYSYEALQVWAKELGREIQPQQTAREFCQSLGDVFPEVDSELSRLSMLYGHAAFGRTLPRDCELESVGRLWRFMSGSPVTTAA